MMDVNVLKPLAGQESSGVRLRKNHQLTLSLSQSFATSVELGVAKVLLTKFLEYEPSLDGVLLNTEDCKDIQVVSKFAEFFVVSVQADCYVFSPAVGTKLNVEIKKVGEKDATAKALKFFTVSIHKVPTDRTLRDGQMVTIKITSVAYSKGVPNITGELVQQDNEVMRTEAANPKRKRKEQEGNARKKKKVKKAEGINESLASVSTTPAPPASAPAPKTRELPAVEKKSDKKVNLDKESIEVLSKYVESSWNIADDGEIRKTKNRWFKSEELKGYPKKALYFSV